jgi:hypothetical protein
LVLFLQKKNKDLFFLKKKRQKDVSFLSLLDVAYQAIGFLGSSFALAPAPCAAPE